MSWGNTEWDPDCDSELAKNLFTGDNSVKKKKKRKKRRNNQSDSFSGVAASDGRFVRVHQTADNNDSTSLHVKPQGISNNKRKLSAKSNNPPKKIKLDNGFMLNNVSGYPVRYSDNKKVNSDEKVGQPERQKTKKRKRKKKMSTLKIPEESKIFPKQKKIHENSEENVNGDPKHFFKETARPTSNKSEKTKSKQRTSVDSNFDSNVSHTKNIIAKRKNVKEENAQKSIVSMKTKSSYNVKQLKQYLKKYSSPTMNITPIKETTNSLREKMMKKLQASHFRYINEQLYNSKSEESKTFFQKNISTFEAYHEGYRQQVSKWPLNPLTVITNYLKKKPARTVIADFGCGEAQLAKSLPDHKVYSFDFVATSDVVTPCDMSNTPLKNESVDVVVFCLSLMGSNLASFILEANRVLKNGGMLMIAEVESRFENIDTFIQDIKKFGFSNTWKDFSHKIFYFVYFKKVISVKKSSKLPCMFLKPCLYKKR